MYAFDSCRNRALTPPLDERFQNSPLSSREPYFRAVAHHRNRLAPEARLNFSDSVHVHDCRPMRSAKFTGIEPGFVLSDALVPSLILQPIVENALIHGVAKSRGPITISISAIVSGTTLTLEVTDDGPGIDNISILESSGIGLRNCRDRLHHLYGSAGSLDALAADLFSIPHSHHRRREERHGLLDSF